MGADDRPGALVHHVRQQADNTEGGHEPPRRPPDGERGDSHPCSLAYRQAGRAWIGSGDQRHSQQLRKCAGRLGCWCAPELCHAEVIAELADSPAASSLR
ncbi:DUF4326 domain-containing protein [Micromonospora sp. CA-259024]|uniref:DUF4326 domain-containing protein n=1 Tax=Micromonospora sp. CA-259024 TaxID=3239965 RepID=UPI003D91765C